MDTIQMESLNQYKRIEKLYKYRKLEPNVDMESVVDLRNAEEWINKGIVCKYGSYQEDTSRTIDIFSLNGPENQGFYIIPNALDITTQLTLAEAALKQFIEPPHRTNLTCQYSEKQLGRLWESQSPLIEKLRWSAMGYHYDWTNRLYNLDCSQWRSPMPKKLYEISKNLAHAIGDSIVPEAALVNFYQPNSMMGGHQDDVEETFDAPVVSISLGLSAIFLKGGTKKSIAPIPCLVRSGDVVIMSRESRLSFHGVPRILESSNPLKWHGELPDNLKGICDYLDHSRINLNVRQVQDQHFEFRTK